MVATPSTCARCLGSSGQYTRTGVLGGIYPEGVENTGQMLHHCPECGTTREDMDVQRDVPVVVCPDCDRERSFVLSPLCIVTGAAGTGKTTVRRRLAGAIDAMLLEDDSIAHESCEFDTESGFNEYVLRLCRDVAQSRVPPVLFTTGLGVPENVEGLVNRRYFAETHYLALVCETETQANRLRARGSPWTDEGEGGYWADVGKQTEFNEWFQANATDEGIDLVDTTDQSVDETTAVVIEWLAERLESVADPA
jgi:broad-specificity NMP kinase